MFILQYCYSEVSRVSLFVFILQYLLQCATCYLEQLEGLLNYENIVISPCLYYYAPTTTPLNLRTWVWSNSHTPSSANLTFVLQVDTID